MRYRVGAVTLTMLFGAACSTPGNEVVFEGSPSTEATAAAPVTTAAPDPVTTSQPAGTESGTAPTVSTTSISQPGTTAIATTTATTVPAGLELSDRGLDALTARVLVEGRMGSGVTVLGPSAARTGLYTADGYVAQPAWSADGRLVAFSEVSGTASRVIVAPAAGGSSTSYETPFVVFYIHWSPDGRSVAMLGSAGEAQVGLAVLDLDSGTVNPIEVANSYYLHWSPDGSSLLTHLDNSRLRILDPASGETTPIATFEFFWSAYQAPSWMPDGDSILYLRPAADQDEEPQDELVRHHLAGDRIEVIGTGAGFFDFAASPDGKTVAYSLQTLDFITSMYLVELATGETQRIDAPTTVAWEWSPDSRKILLLGVGEDRRLTLDVYEDGAITPYGAVVPSENFLRGYIAFWGQYDHSHTLWAPDSSAFVYAATDRGADYVFLQLLEEELPILLGAGSMAVFAPEPG